MAVFAKLLLALSQVRDRLDLDGSSTSIARWSHMDKAVLDSYSDAFDPLPDISKYHPNTAAVYLYGPGSEANFVEGDIFYLPLGQQIFVRNYPLLPIQPSYGQLLEVVVDTPAAKTDFRCTAYTRAEEGSALRVQGANAAQQPDLQLASPSSVSFDLDDKLVDFGYPSSHAFLGDGEIESYICR